MRKRSYYHLSLCITHYTLLPQLRRQKLLTDNCIVTQLLEKDTQRRLGATSDFDEVSKHKFFTSINWNLLNKRMITPPFIPDLVREAVSDFRSLAERYNFIASFAIAIRCRPSVVVCLWRECIVTKWLMLGSWSFLSMLRNALTLCLPSLIRLVNPWAILLVNALFSFTLLQYEGSEDEDKIGAVLYIAYTSWATLDVRTKRNQIIKDASYCNGAEAKVYDDWWWRIAVIICVLSVRCLYSVERRDGFQAYRSWIRSRTNSW